MHNEYTSERINTEMRGIVFGKITLKWPLNSVAASVAVRIEKDRHREQMAQHISCNLLIYLDGTIRQPPSHGRSHWFNPSTAYHEYQGVTGQAVTPFPLWLFLPVVLLRFSGQTFDMEIKAITAIFHRIINVT